MTNKCWLQQNNSNYCLPAPTVEDAQAMAMDLTTSKTTPLTSHPYLVMHIYHNTIVATNHNKTTTLEWVTLSMPLMNSCLCPRDTDNNSVQHS